ncbi:unnamed protein product [Rangifer tarandus platyrhynchus]|uniref:Uncharacterized protein n=2 Tax=Rangifer tarandus platyrhynchus TaxID=3082113 RepID=A0ABN8Y9B0_RANTA|nr:unnamed protein product [Rangifer tarandus platyrhynchus]
MGRGLGLLLLEFLVDEGPGVCTLCPPSPDQPPAPAQRGTPSHPAQAGGRSGLPPGCREARPTEAQRTGELHPLPGRKGVCPLRACRTFRGAAPLRVLLG